MYLLYDTVVAALRKHDVDVLKLRKMSSVYKTPLFDLEILLEFDINTLHQLKNYYSFAQTDEILPKCNSRVIRHIVTVLKAVSRLRSLAL